MNCSEVQNLIPQYLSGELDDDIRRRVEEHISGCPDCQEGMRREQSLGDLIGQSADDPPDEYWNDYNAKVRSRIRGVVGMLWRMGCLPVCLLGLIGGEIAGKVCAWLTFGNGLGGIHPVWLRWLLDSALLVIVGGGAGIIGGLVISRAITRGLPKYEREERGLKQIISRNPWYRAAFLAFFIMAYLAAPVVLIWMLVPNMHFPAWVRGTLAVLWFIIFSSIILGCYWYLKYYLDGRTDSIICRARNLWDTKKRPLSFWLIQLYLLIVPGSLAVDYGISQYLLVPSNCRQEAESAYESGDVDSAVSILRSGIKKYGNRYRVLECYEYLGRIYAETGKWEQSRVIFHDGVKTYERLLLHPKYSYSKDDQLDFLGDAAQLYIDLGQNREAYQLYSTRLHLSPNDPENMYSVAQQYVVMGYKGEARTLYTKIILEFPNSDEARWAQQDIRDMH